VTGATGLDDVERETALQLHAGSSENRTQGARCATLLADHFANIAGSYVKAENRGILIGQDLDLNRSDIVYQGPGNFSHQGLHFGDSELAIRQHRRIRHSYTSGSIEPTPQDCEPLL
jgi:hypothetical protein